MNGNSVGIILAAGVGSRLRPLTNDKPKCLLEVGNETILHRSIRLLKEAGVARVIVATGFKDQMVRDALADAKLPVQFVHNPDFASTQNSVSMARAISEVRAEERVVKLDGDVVFQPELLQRLLREEKATAVAVERTSSPPTEAMKVVVDRGRVMWFGKGIEAKGAYGESVGIESIAPTAVPKVSEAFRRSVGAGRTDQYYEDVYNDVLGAVAMQVCDVQADEWLEIDDSDDYAQAQKKFGKE